MCHGAGTERSKTRVIERPGSYFAGPIGTFIPAGGRLLLSIAERLAAVRGIGIAICDTDSLMFARPDGMSRGAFRQHVREIIDFFTPLSPYRGQPPLLELEDDNEWNGQPEPLYGLAISAKRYALYNRRPDGTYRIRKFSSHATGRYRLPKDYAPRTDIPEPYERDESGKPDTVKLGGPRWLYDLWYAAIEQAESGESYLTLDSADWLDAVAETQVTITTRYLHEQYRTHFPTLRPFDFIEMLPALGQTDVTHRKMAEQVDTEFLPIPNGYPERYDGLEHVALYRSPEGLRRIDTHALVDRPRETITVYNDRAELIEVPSACEGWTERLAFQPKTLRECLSDYFRHPESKAANPRGIGWLERRHLSAVEHVYIGKETNQVLLEVESQSDGGHLHRDAHALGRTGISGAIRACGIDRLVSVLIERETPVPRTTLQRIGSGQRPKPSIMRAILDALDACETMNQVASLQ